jgi:hypothetical protein
MDRGPSEDSEQPGNRTCDPQMAPPDPSATESPLANILQAGLGPIIPSATDVQSIKAHLFPMRLPQAIFSPLPPKHLLFDLLTGTVQSISFLWPLITSEEVSDMTSAQYLLETESAPGAPIRWAFVNAVLALSVQLKTASTAVGALFPVSWAYFKNAFTIFPQLMLEGQDHHALRTVLTMALFAQGTADTRTAHNLAGSALYLGQVLLTYWQQSALRPDHHLDGMIKRLLWMSHIISTRVAIRCELPLLSRNDPVDLEPPSIAPHSETGLTNSFEAEVFGHRARLSVIQSEILLETRRSRKSGMSRAQRLEGVERLCHQAQQWSMALPSVLQVTKAKSGMDVDPLITDLHLSYFATLYKLHALVDEVDKRHQEELRAGGSELSSTLPLMAVDEAARASLMRLSQIMTLPTPQLW